MPNLIEFKHPVNKSKYKHHQLSAGTNLQAWLNTNKPASANLSISLNKEIITDFNIELKSDDVVSISPFVGFGVDWVVWAMLAVSMASTIYAMSMMPDTTGTGDSKQASSVYNYNAQGNKSRFGNPVPIHFGRCPNYPDIITPAWWEYILNEQHHYQIFSHGCGKFDFHGHYIGETLIDANNPDIEIQTFPPGTLINNFPHIVWTSKEVGGGDGQQGLKLDAPVDKWVGHADAHQVRFSVKNATLYKSFSTNGGTQYTPVKWPWPAGMHIVISQTETRSQIFEGNLTFIDGGTGPEPDLIPLPDKIQNVLGWDFLKAGDRIILSGAGENSGTFNVAKITGNLMEVNDDAGKPITNFTPATNVFSKIYMASSNDGTYKCTDDKGGLALVDADDNPVPDWPGFIAMESISAILALREKDRLAEWTGDYLCVPQADTALDVGIDFVFPRGLGEMGNDKIESRTVEWELRYRIAGTAEPYKIVPFTQTMADNTPLRLTKWLSKEAGVNFVPGTYEIGCRRKTLVTDSTKIFDELQWMGLKSVILREYKNDEETIITVKIKATNALSQQANQKYWNDSTAIKPCLQADGSFIEKPTRSISDAVIDACINNVYGAGLPLDAVDKDTLLAYRAVWNSRGDYCDGRFDSPTAFWDALNKILLTGRSYPRIDLGVISLWRDEERKTLRRPYSPINMTGDSFKVDMQHVESDAYDAVEIEWFNPVTRKAETLVKSVAGQDGYNPKPLKMPFITSLEHATREALFHAAVQAYRNTSVKWSTDIGGWESNYGDLVPISHDSVEWGESGEVMEYDKTTGRLLLSGLLTFGTAQSYIMFDDQPNSNHGPYRVEKTDVDGVVILIDTPTRPIFEVGVKDTPSQYHFGSADSLNTNCIIQKVSQKGEFAVSITSTKDDSRVWSTPGI